MPVLNTEYFLSLRDNLDKLGVKNYTVRSDGTVDVDGDVRIAHQHLTEIPVQFGIVRGLFDSRYNQLTSLAGSPKSVSGSFFCSSNRLTSLAGCPETVQGDFWCHGNQLTSLAGCPETVQGDFWCHGNQKQFTESEVKAVCKVSQKIYV